MSQINRLVALTGLIRAMVEDLSIKIITVENGRGEIFTIGPDTIPPDEEKFVGATVDEVWIGICVQGLSETQNHDFAAALINMAKHSADLNMVGISFLSPKGGNCITFNNYGEVVNK